MDKQTNAFEENAYRDALENEDEARATPVKAPIPLWVWLWGAMWFAILVYGAYNILVSWVL